MKTDDEAARKARADRLHNQIDGLVDGTAKTPNGLVPPTQSAPPAQDSPRDFINRRMRELKDKEAGA
jgi:hypothetical protein